MAPSQTPLALEIVQFAAQLDFCVLIPCFVVLMSSMTSMTSFFLLSEFDEAWWALFSSAWALVLAFSISKKEVTFEFNYEFMAQILIYVWSAIGSGVAIIPYIILEYYSVAFFSLLCLAWLILLLQNIKSYRDKITSGRRKSAYINIDRLPTTQWSPLWVFIFKLIKWFLLLTILGLQSMAVYEVVWRTNDLLRFPARGERYRVDSNKVHILCRGVGTPVVMLDSDYSESYLTWYYVQEEISRTTRVCAYDRAGYGWSESGSIPRASRRVSEDLDGLINEAIKNNLISEGKYVFVSSGSSGLFHRYFAGDESRVERVAAMLLVHPNHEDQIQAFNEKDGKTEAEGKRERSDRRAELDRARVFAPLGVARIAIDLGAFETNAKYLPSKEGDMENAVSCTSSFINVAYHEYRYFESSCDEVRQQREFNPYLGSFPIDIVTAWDEDQETTAVLRHIDRYFFSFLSFPSFGLLFITICLIFRISKLSSNLMPIS
eukprot:TRINITY_DN11103_c0_g1_i6.p1 TRINITY_DN11103_c0_g1~~TRINITY_DN11103_c0_g1_i6.p1  ORF type:complete len:490 (-),score=95.92 TRINITY_DN11103_c0_g1_i6:40-1509(-)